MVGAIGRQAVAARRAVGGSLKADIRRYLSQWSSQALVRAIISFVGGITTPRPRCLAREPGGPPRTAGWGVGGGGRRSGQQQMRGYSTTRDLLNSVSQSAIWSPVFRCYRARRNSDKICIVSHHCVKCEPLYSYHSGIMQLSVV